MVAELHVGESEVIIPLAEDGSRIDLTNLKSLASIDWDVDVVFMFAGVTGTGASFDLFDTFLKGNELSLLNVLDSIRRSQYRPRILFPSTRLVYRGGELPLLETDLQASSTLYAANKIACEHYLNAYAKTFDIPHTIFRVGVPYANLQSDQYSYGTVGNLITQARKNGKIVLYGGGKVRRTFTHIQDLSDIILRASLHAETVNQTYNIPGENLSLYDAALLVAARIDGATIGRVDWPEFDLRIESGDTIFDAKKLTDLLNFRLMYNFRDWTDRIPI